MNIKKNDTVIVLSGKDKGVKGKVLVAMPTANKGIGDTVEVMETRPLSKDKRWRLVRIIEKAK